MAERVPSVQASMYGLAGARGRARWPIRDSSGRSWCATLHAARQHRAHQHYHEGYPRAVIGT